MAVESDGRLISAGVAVVAAANLVLFGSLVPALLRRGAPFVPTARAKVDALFGSGGILARGGVAEARGPVRELRLIDLGSGDGSLLRGAARAGYGHATGYEINPALVALSKAWPHRGTSTSTETRWGSMWEADVSSADVITCYGVPPIMERLGLKLRDELPAGAIICSNGYEVPLLGEPLAVRFIETSSWSPDASSHLFIYRAPGAGIDTPSRGTVRRGN